MCKEKGKILSPKNCIKQKYIKQKNRKPIKRDLTLLTRATNNGIIASKKKGNIYSSKLVISQNMN